MTNTYVPSQILKAQQDLYDLLQTLSFPSEATSKTFVQDMSDPVKEFLLKELDSYSKQHNERNTPAKCKKVLSKFLTQKIEGRSTNVQAVFVEHGIPETQPYMNVLSEVIDDIVKNMVISMKVDGNRNVPIFAYGGTVAQSSNFDTDVYQTLQEVCSRRGSAFSLYVQHIPSIDRDRFTACLDQYNDDFKHVSGFLKKRLTGEWVSAVSVVKDNDHITPARFQKDLNTVIKRLASGIS